MWIKRGKAFGDRGTLYEGEHIYTRARVQGRRFGNKQTGSARLLLRGSLRCFNCFKAACKKVNLDLESTILFCEAVFRGGCGGLLPAFAQIENAARPQYFVLILVRLHRGSVRAARGLDSQERVVVLHPFGCFASLGTELGM
jgi:hypothetical protein